MLKKLGFLVAKHPIITITSWVIVAAVIVATAIGGVFGQSLFDRLSSDQPKVASESTTADNLLKDAQPDSENIILVLNKAKVGDKEVASLVKTMSDELKQKPYVKDVISPAGVPNQYLVATPELDGLVSKSADGGLLVLVTVKQDGNKTENTATIHEAIDDVKSYVPKFEDIGIKADVANQTLYSEQIVQQASEDLRKGELVSLPLALIVLILVFGGFMAAGMPLIGAIMSIVGGLGTLFVSSYFLDIDTTVLNVLTVIGLGLSIDYGLLMISRFREVLRSKPETHDKKSVYLAVSETVATAGKTVTFSGLTIAICTFALILFDASLMKSIAIATAAVILVAIISSLTLLPAFFSLLGYKLIHPSPLTKVPGLGAFLNRFGDVAPEEGFFSGLARKIQKAPALVLAGGVAVLLLLGSSVLNLQVSNYGTPYLAHLTGQAKIFDTLAKDYPAFKTYDLTLVVKGTDEKATLAKAENYKTFLTDQKGITETVAPVFNKDGGFATVQANVRDNKTGQKLVPVIRDHVKAEGDKGDVLLTGNPARDVDFNNSLLSVAWLVAGIIVLTTFILLFLMTGSILVPIKAILLSALSLGASIGVITWGFEEGNLAGLLNFDASQITGISPIILVLILVFGFGLAMDYEVFLVSRMKEEYDKTGDHKLAIQRGLQGSGRIITSAGLIIVLVFLGFAFGDMLMVKQIGVALAVAVLVDMTIVRCLLVPAVMDLFGHAAWWSPKWMKRIYKKVGISHS